ncbi:MAG: formylglycine-generating enzyme family protein, partial [Acidobacteria bacterium]|nr:formylglycine-generating enzyme family protein [Acidobacteriota bacterium]
MFIFDSCFAGTIFSRSTGNSSGGKAPPLIMEKAALPVRQFITSGTAMQEVPDRSDFRLLLERAFDDRAADFYPRDGYVTGEELGRYLAGQVASVSRGTQTPEYGKIKEVRLQRGDMVFRLPNEKAEEKVTTPSESSGACDLAWGDLERSPSETGYEIFIKNCRSSKWLITAEIRLAAIRAAAVVRPVQDTNEAVGLEFWRSIAESQNVRDYEGYLRQFPNGQFAELARSRIEKLRLPVYRSVSFKTGQITESKLTPSQAECEVYTEDLGNGVKLEMVKIPGGEFQMGSPDSESGRYVDEGPVHRVTLKGFLMGRYEVTQRVWRAVAALPKIELELNPEPSVFKGDELPVESVTWHEVKEFIARLNRWLGLEDAKGYRLPSEAEWEYAARGGTATPFGFGETISPSIVNYDGNFPYGRGIKGERRGKTIAVGSLGMANRYGLYDMHGNVWEWCEDEFHENYNGAPIDGRAWVSS